MRNRNPDRSDTGLIAGFLAQLVQGEEDRGDAAGADDLVGVDFWQKLLDRHGYDLEPLVLVGTLRGDKLYPAGEVEVRPVVF
jgi:hypothetical protein